MAAQQQNAVQRRFDYLRQKTEGDLNRQEQGAKEGMQRQAASKGMLGSGVQAKLEAKQTEQIAGMRQQALGDVESQRELALAEQDEREAQRTFAREERLGSQQFASGEAQRQRAFESSEAKAQRGFSKELFDKDMAFKQKGLTLENKKAKDAWDLSVRQLKLDEKVSKFNMDMATKMWNKKDMMEWFANMHGYDPRTGKQGAPLDQALGWDSGGGPKM